jgi:hypothetical protein
LRASARRSVNNEGDHVPDIEVASGDYARAFDDLLTALHENRSLILNLTAAGSAPPKLDKQNLPLEIRIYLEGRMRDVIAQDPETYATDSREIDVQTDELIDKINSVSSRQHKEATPLPNSERPTSFHPFEYGELKASVEKRGGSISAAMNAEQLQAQLSDDQWSKTTNIDPEAIAAEERRQQQPYVPDLRRYNLESRLAQTLLEDERIRVHMRPQ